jgi:hypothetical protein
VDGWSPGIEAQDLSNLGGQGAGGALLVDMSVQVANIALSERGWLQYHRV